MSNFLRKILFVTPETGKKLSRIHKRDLVLVTVALSVALIVLGTFAFGTFQNYVNQAFSPGWVARATLEVNEWYDPGVNPRWNSDIHVINNGDNEIVTRIRISELMLLQDSVIATESALLTSILSDFSAHAASVHTTANINYETRITVPDEEWSVHGLTFPGIINGNPAQNYNPINRFVHTDLPSVTDPFGGPYEGGAMANYRWQWDTSTIIHYSGPNGWKALYDQNPNDPQLKHKWVLCDDGFFYYSSPILSKPQINAGEGSVGERNASSMLIDDVWALFDVTKRAYYYALNVEMDAITFDDFGSWMVGREPNYNPEEVDPMHRSSPQALEFLSLAFPGAYTDALPEMQAAFP